MSTCFNTSCTKRSRWGYRQFEAAIQVAQDEKRERSQHSQSRYFRIDNVTQTCDENDLAEYLEALAEAADREAQELAQQQNEMEANDDAAIPFDFPTAAAQRDYIACQLWLSYKSAMRERGHKVN